MVKSHEEDCNSRLNQDLDIQPFLVLLIKMLSIKSNTKRIKLIKKTKVHHELHKS